MAADLSEVDVSHSAEAPDAFPVLPADGATFTPTGAHQLAALRLVYRPRRRRAVIYLLLIGIGLLNIALALVQPRASRAVSLDTGVLLVLAAPAWRLLLNLWILPHYARRQHRQNAVLHDVYEVSWSEAGLASRTPRTTSLIAWSDYIAQREDRDMLVLYQTDTMFQFLPKRAIAPAGLARLAILMREVPDRPWVGI